jgi:PAS domain S-box-containing protein
MIEHSSDIITVLDQDGIIRYESPSITKVLGYSVTDCLGHSAFDYIHPEDVAEARRAFHRGLTSREPVFHRFRRRHRDGSWTVLESHGRMIDGDGEPPIVVINSRDVTEREHLQRQLVDAQKMESVGRLAGGVAHDFNNLLTVIKGNTELALAGLPPGSPVRGEIEDIREAAERAAQLTRQLLTFARRQIVAAKVIDVNDVVSRTDRLLRRLIGANIELVTAPLDRGAFVRVDPVQLEQVILNLAVNARDAMPHGGSLEIKVGHCRVERAEAIRGLEPGPHVTITVRDTGTGMTEEVRRHLFEPFFTTKPMGAGTGLGLATSYGVVRQSGGAIEVKSELGRGSWFTVLLPEVAGPEAESKTGPRAPRTSGEETILVVEDDPAVRRLAVAALRKLGYRLLEAGDGQEAQEIIEAGSGRVGLVVTDVVMPRVGGVELAAKLRVLQEDLPVVFTTGYTEALRSSDLAPRSALLLKPYSADELAVEVRRLLDLPRPVFQSAGTGR